MKTLTLILFVAAFAIVSCSSSKYTASYDYDDIYYNPGEVQKQAEVVSQEPVFIQSQPVITPEQAMNVQPLPREQDNAVAEEALSDYEKYRMQMEAEILGESYDVSGSEAAYYDQYQYYDSLNYQAQEQLSPVIINNYYYNDPNDYYYSSNIRRFSDSYYGWDYYDPYYTSLYFYTGRPIHWGMSIGYGYPFGGFGMSYGYPYSSWGWGGYYDPWYSPYYYDYYYPGYYGYYPGYYGYNPYYRGSYWSGYNSGYYHGYYNRYYYGAAKSNYRYGHLDNRYTYGYSRSESSDGGSKGSTYIDPRYRTRSSESTVTERSGQSTTVDPRRENANAAVRTRTEVQRGTDSGNTVAPARSVTPNTVRTTRPVEPNTPMDRGSSVTPQNRTYTPSYSKPRTSTTPTYNTTTPSRSSTPARTGTDYTPSRSGTSSSYSRPGTSSGSSSYSAPRSSTYSAPSRSSSSSSSYSAPSRSSSSSSVSRSSSSSSSSSSSGSSSSRSSSSRR